MFERFTDRCRMVVNLAQQIARELGHDHIGTEHMLLGLIREGGGVAARALESLGIDTAQVSERIVEIVGRGSGAPAGHIGFTAGAKRSLELSLREAVRSGHNYLGTEHLLLGLIREAEGVAAQVLVSFGANLEEAQGAIGSLLAEQRPAAVGETVWRNVRRAGARQPAPPSMTEREMEVLRLFSEGDDEDEIARKLSISSNTVRSHLRNIYEKFSLHTKMTSFPLPNPVAPQGMFAPPACPSCKALLSHSARHHIMEVPSDEDDGHPATVLLLYCSQCGHTLDDVILPGE